MIIVCFKLPLEVPHDICAIWLHNLVQTGLISPWLVSLCGCAMAKVEWPLASLSRCKRGNIEIYLKLLLFYYGCFTV